MNLSHYITLDYLNEILSSKTISSTAGGIIIVLYLVGLLPFGISLFVIPFTIYLIAVLYKNNKNGWIVGFFIWIGISFLPYFLMSNDNLLLIALKFAPILFFFLYLMVLKEKVGEWLIEEDYGELSS